ncbi:putative leader peptide [Streptomyces sp. NPDC093586]
MGSVQPVAADVSCPPGPSPLLTSRRHIDLLRVCSAVGSPS